MAVKLRIQSEADERGIKKAKRGLSGLKNHGVATAKKIAGAIAGAFAFAGLLRGAKSLINAFAVQEDAVNDLRSALVNNGDTADGLLEKYQALASALQNLSRHGDEEILATIALGRNMGILEKDLERATIAAVGLSAKMKIDLKTAMQLIAKASAGDTASLKRYGIVLKDTLNPQQKYAELLRIGADGMRQSADQTETTTGKINQLSKMYGDLKEKMGELLVEGTPILDMLDQMILYLDDLVQTEAGDWAIGVANAFNVLGGVFDNVRDSLQWIAAFSTSIVTGQGLDASLDIADEVLDDLRKEREDRQNRIRERITRRRQQAEGIVESAQASSADATMRSPVTMANIHNRVTQRINRELSKMSAQGFSKSGFASGFAPGSRRTTLSIEADSFKKKMGRQELRDMAAGISTRSLAGGELFDVLAGAKRTGQELGERGNPMFVHVENNPTIGAGDAD